MKLAESDANREICFAAFLCFPLFPCAFLCFCRLFSSISLLFRSVPCFPVFSCVFFCFPPFSFVSLLFSSVILLSFPLYISVSPFSRQFPLFSAVSAVSAVLLCSSVFSCCSPFFSSVIFLGFLCFFWFSLLPF